MQMNIETKSNSIF